MGFLKRIFSMSSVATLLTCFYTFISMKSVYNLMYPLHSIDVTTYKSSQLVKPYWKSKSKSKSSLFGMKVYLSTNEKFHMDFLIDEYQTKQTQLLTETEDYEENQRTIPRKSKSIHDSILLWEESHVTNPSLSKSFILTNQNNNNGESSSLSSSFEFAKECLEKAHQQSLSDAKGSDVEAVLASATAGEGIASTSFILSLYSGMRNTIENVFNTIRGQGTENDDKDGDKEKVAFSPSVVSIPQSSSIWSNLMKNSTVHIHVILLREEENGSSGSKEGGFSPNFRKAAQSIQKASKSYNLLAGDVNLVKYDIPHHISKPKRFLYRDLLYLFRYYILRNIKSDEEEDVKPWDNAKNKPYEHELYQNSLQMKEKGVGYPYWKPEVSIKLVSDDEVYPIEYSNYSGMELIKVDRQMARTGGFESGFAYMPGLHVDEIGLTSEKYVPLNETVDALPLRISFDSYSEGDDDEAFSSDESTTSLPSPETGVGSGGLSPARWRLLSHLSQGLENQKEMGFDQSDIDDVRRLIADTNVTLLAITVLASTLHLLFEFLTFKTEVEFWRGNKDLTGLSVRALGMDFIGQVVILLFLIESGSSLLMTAPSAVGCLIALWKCQRGAGFKFVKLVPSKNTTTSTEERPSVAVWNKVFHVFGYELQATRLRAAMMSRKDKKKDTNTQQSSNDNDGTTEKDLGALSEEMDRLATKILGKYLLLPLVLLYTVYTLVKHEHPGWYSWFITSASSAVYALGFVLMTPQLFLNYKLKSVAHLPWKVLCYRFINTFIDDLFAFIIRMPTMARISCFRDDVVFVIYLWQRYLYPVDTSRPVEGGGMDAVSAAASNAVVDSTTDGSGDKKKKE